MKSQIIPETLFPFVQFTFPQWQDWFSDIKYILQRICADLVLRIEEWLFFYNVKWYFQLSLSVSTIWDTLMSLHDLVMLINSCRSSWINVNLLDIYCINVVSILHLRSVYSSSNTHVNNLLKSQSQKVIWNAKIIIFSFLKISDICKD